MSTASFSQRSPVLAPGGGAAPPSSGGSRTVLIGVVGALAVLALVLVGLNVFTAGSETEDQVTATARTEADADVDEAPTADRTGDGAAPVIEEDPEPESIEPAPIIESGTTTTAPGPGRAATLWSADAALRSAPALGAGKIEQLVQRDGTPIEILEEADPGSGWYRVRVVDSGTEGYLFGAFVRPPAPGLCVGRLHEGTTPVVTDEFGGVVGGEMTGTKLLIIGPQTVYGWPIVLPGGARGFVDTASVAEVFCP